MDPIKNYLTNIGEIRRSGAGVPETSYYGALETLFNEIGKTLDPKVRCILHPQNTGSGIPDGGIFSWDQYKKNPSLEISNGQIPARGVFEVKPPTESISKFYGSKQTRSYLKKYGKVLLTNLRSFAVIVEDNNGAPFALETSILSDSEQEFWRLAGDPRKLGKDNRLEEFLKRILVASAKIQSAEDLAWILASYAKDARSQLDSANLDDLAALRSALEDALGTSFEGSKGEHFFRATLIQTLFYGIFSAWVIWHRNKGSDRHRSQNFDWRVSSHYLKVPAIKALFDQIANGTRLEPLELTGILDLAGSALNRVNESTFFETFEQGLAVQYFYEPFLQEYDPELRKDLGVWYTPREIVKYMVARIDRVLREDLGIPDGFADDRVLVLDPCCGTGAFLIEILELIAERLKSQGQGALVGSRLKQIAMERIFGFEILPAPFVVSHLQIGLLLAKYGQPLIDKSTDRVGVYLTNALTGWSPAKDKKAPPVVPELENERNAAGKVKRDKKILVVVGNPPYNAFSGISPPEEEGLVEPYKAELRSKWRVKKTSLDDPYVRFFRLADRKISEMSDRGIVSYVSNYSYLFKDSFVVMREKLTKWFDRIWIDNLNGDGGETGKKTPDGRPDPSVFKTPYNKTGIKQGTAICLMVRGGRSQMDGYSDAPVGYRDFWGEGKRESLLQSLNATEFDGEYDWFKPGAESKYCLRPVKIGSTYLEWPSVIDLSSVQPSLGLMEKRGNSLIRSDKALLEESMRDYYDPNISWDEFQATGTRLSIDAARYHARSTRDKVRLKEKYSNDRIKRYFVFPFDKRWCYYSPVRPLWNEPRPSLWKNLWQGNSFLVTRRSAMKTPEGPPFYFSDCLVDDSLLAHAACFPLKIRRHLAPSGDGAQGLIDLDGLSEVVVPNLSDGARQYLDVLGYKGDELIRGAEHLWKHVLAIGFSSAYLNAHSAAIRHDWPRIPLPSTAESLEESARLGTILAALLDPDSAISGLTAGGVGAPFQTIALVEKATGGQIVDGPDDLIVSAGWGRLQSDGVTMPGIGKAVIRSYSPVEVQSIRLAAEARALDGDLALVLLGDQTLDIYLNNDTHWRNVPKRVWEYVIGGWPALKKWLSYREFAILGRSLNLQEVVEFQTNARRLAAIALMEPDLNKNYSNVTEYQYLW